VARDYWEQSRTIMREVGERNGYSMSLQGLGNIARDQGDFTASAAYYEEGISIYREIGNRHGLAEVLHNLGEVIIFQGDGSRSRSYLEQSLALWREIDNKDGIGRALILLGDLAIEEKAYEEARLLHEEAQHLFEELGGRARLPLARNGLAHVKMALQSDDPTIGEMFRQSVKEAQEAGDIQMVIASMMGLAEFLIPTQPLDAAELAGWATESSKASARNKVFGMEELRPMLEKALSATIVQEAWQRGRDLREDQAIEIALTKKA
jgi:tetratricopeptide (TPR) repeat protein